MLEAQALPLAVRPVTRHAKASRVGPNAVIQLGDALRDLLGEEAAQQVFARAGLRHMLAEPPTEMVEEQTVAHLFRVLFDQLPGETAAAVAAEAGRRTAGYILANRIPRPARAVLKMLPANLAGPLLLRAIARHAWTFAGSGEVGTRSGTPSVIEIADNPLAMPDCVWHVAVFEGLFRALVAESTSVRQQTCCHDGARLCRFEITIGSAGPGHLLGRDG